MTVPALPDQAWVRGAMQQASAAVATADDVVAAVAEVLAAHYDLCRVSLRRVLPGGTDVEVVAVWSKGRSELGRGVRMPLRATSIPAVLATGRTQLGNRLQAEDGLLHQLLAAEGIHSYASVPLADPAAGGLVLSLSSSQPNRFSDDDLPVVDAVGSVVAELVAQLPPAPPASRLRRPASAT